MHVSEFFSSIKPHRPLIYKYIINSRQQKCVYPRKGRPLRDDYWIVSALVCGVWRARGHVGERERRKFFNKPTHETMKYLQCELRGVAPYEHVGVETRGDGDAPPLFFPWRRWREEVIRPRRLNFLQMG